MNQALLIVYKQIMIQISISEHFCKNMPVRFSPEFGHSRNPSKTSDLNPAGEGGGGEARLRPATGLSFGGLLAASCQKQGGGEHVLY